MRQREEFAIQFDDAMRSTDKEWRCRVDEMKRACDASVVRESELKRGFELESLRRREADAALKEARESVAELQEKLRDSMWRGEDLQSQVDAHVRARDMLAIEHKATLDRSSAASERLLSEAAATNRTLEAEAARLQDELTRARAVHAVDLQRLQVPQASFISTANPHGFRPLPPLLHSLLVLSPPSSSFRQPSSSPPLTAAPPPPSSPLQELHARASNDASERHGRQMCEMEEALKAASAGTSVLQEEWQVRDHHGLTRLLAHTPHVCWHILLTSGFAAPALATGR
jgi:hypothetical protein